MESTHGQALRQSSLTNVRDICMNDLILISAEEKVALFAIISDEVLPFENAVNSQIIDEMLPICAHKRTMQLFN